METERNARHCIHDKMVVLHFVCSVNTTVCSSRTTLVRLLYCMRVVIFWLDGMYELFNIMVTSFDVQDVKCLLYHVVN